MIKSHRYDSLNAGKHLVIFGAVHGDEKCGPEAIERLIKKLILVRSYSKRFTDISAHL